MSFVGHGWRTGSASDITGAAPTCTVSSISPTTAARKATITLTVNGTGFTTACVVYAAYGPYKTVFVSATQLRVDNFYVMTDSGLAGSIAVAVRKGTEALSNSATLTVT